MHRLWSETGEEPSLAEEGDTSEPLRKRLKAFDPHRRVRRREKQRAAGRVRLREPEEEEDTEELSHKRAKWMPALWSEGDVMESVLEKISRWEDVVVWVAVGAQALVEHMQDLHQEAIHDGVVGRYRQLYLSLQRKLQQAWRRLDLRQMAGEEQRHDAIRHLRALLEILGAGENCLFAKEEDCRMPSVVYGQERQPREEVLYELRRRLGLFQSLNPLLSYTLQEYGYEVSLASVPFLTLLARSSLPLKRFVMDLHEKLMLQRMSRVKLSPGKEVNSSLREEALHCVFPDISSQWKRLLLPARQSILELWMLAFCE